MNTQWISIDAADGGKFDAYLALPPTGKGPGIVLIQEIFGVNSHIQGVARQYASDGYVVLAPDLFWRITPRVELGYDQAGFGEGIKMMQALDMKMAVSDLSATAIALRARSDVTGKIASIGYCLGGRLSYVLASEQKVDAAVAYYGGGIQDDLERADRVACPMLFNYGEKDSHIPKEAVDAVKAKFAGRSDVTVISYTDADHGFNCWDRGSYNQKASALAHGNSLAFLSKEIS